MVNFFLFLDVLANTCWLCAVCAWMHLDAARISRWGKKKEEKDDFLKRIKEQFLLWISWSFVRIFFPFWCFWRFFEENFSLMLIFKKNIPNKENFSPKQIDFCSIHSSYQFLESIYFPFLVFLLTGKYFPPPPL